MDEIKNKKIMDKLTKVCVCKGISRAAIKKAIRDGAKTVSEVQGVTGAGSGSCCGKRCESKIKELIEEYNK